MKYIPHLLMMMAAFGCQSGIEEGKTIASTHPILEEQLQEDSVRTPISSNEKPELYQRYRLMLEEYSNESSYQVQYMYSGPLAPLDSNSHTDARELRTALQIGLQEGVNFAGQYTVVSVGCGTYCQTHYVVDRQNGKVSDKIQSGAGASYSSNSRLFILNAADASIDYSACSHCTPEAYVFEDGQFRKLSEVQN